MYSFENDYSEGAHPRILEMLIKSNLEQNSGYGEDKHSKRAEEYIKRHMNRSDVDVHFISGGTLTNLLAASAFLRPHRCVISADTGHINVHEAGAIEATGHKVYVAGSTDGKLSPQSIEAAIAYHSDEHMVKPGMVYISNSTELGTIYSKEELADISKVCRENDLILFLDGARLGSALTCKANDMNLSDIAEVTDVFYIGGTKNGALLGEALVIVRDDLKPDFRYITKQRGALLAKGFVTAMQFEILFEGNLFFELGRHANQMAERLEKIIRDLRYSFYIQPCTNQLFPIMPNKVLKLLSEKFKFQYTKTIDEEHSVIRLVTSWVTTKKAVDLFGDELNLLETQFPNLNFEQQNGA